MAQDSQGARGARHRRGDLVSLIESRIDRRPFQDTTWEGTFFDYLDIVNKDPAVSATRTSGSTTRSCRTASRSTVFQEGLRPVPLLLRPHRPRHATASSAWISRSCSWSISSAPRPRVTAPREARERHPDAPQRLVQAGTSPRRRAARRRRTRPRSAAKVYDDHASLRRRLAPGDAHVKVRRITLSEKDRIGIGTFQPRDEKNQDSTGAHRRHQLPQDREFGSDSDPRAFNFDGEFNIANRGIASSSRCSSSTSRSSTTCLARPGAPDQTQEVRADRHRRGDPRAHQRARVQAPRTTR